MNGWLIAGIVTGLVVVTVVFKLLTNGQNAESHPVGELHEDESEDKLENEEVSETPTDYVEPIEDKKLSHLIEVLKKQYHTNNGAFKQAYFRLHDYLAQQYNLVIEVDYAFTTDGQSIELTAYTLEGQDVIGGIRYNKVIIDGFGVEELVGLNIHYSKPESMR